MSVFQATDEDLRGSRPMESSRTGADWLAAALLVLAMAAVSWVILDRPAIGFDDANITMVYARNIAEGHGYVYNIGGERVEGSTSVLWTFYNALIFFLFPSRPEAALIVTGFAIAMATIYLALRTGRRLMRLSGRRESLAPWCMLPVFALYPAFFGWMIWSLMDIALWVLMVTALVYLIGRLLEADAMGAAGVAGTAAAGRLAGSGQAGAGQAGAGRDGAGPAGAGRGRPRAAGADPGAGAAFVILSALIVLVRPEGLALGAGMALLLLLVGLTLTERRIVALPLLALAAVAVAAVALTAARMAYFGYPQPNTYYAKVSTSYLAQIRMGLGYTKSYFMEAPYLALTLTALAGALMPAFAGTPPARRRAFDGLFLVTAGVVAGALAVYTILGGDHFGSWRFYLIFVPLLMPFAGSALAEIAGAAAHRLAATGTAGRAVFAAVAAGLVVAMGLVTWGDFLIARGHYSQEIRIARDGREVGARLNALPDDPSVGILPAGGTAMGYNGFVYDLLGLNWVEMAHADRAGNVKKKNHGGFSRKVFFAHLPDVVDPRLMECDAAAYLARPEVAAFLDNLYLEPEFRAQYDFACAHGLAFMIRRDFAARRPEAAG